VRRMLKVIAGLGVLAALAWFLAAHQNQIRHSVVDRDSIAYWAAAKILLQHQNPYNAQSVLALEQHQGYGLTKPLVLRTPPWSLWIFAPLGMLNVGWAWVVWMVALLAALLASMRICWGLYGDSGKPPAAFLVVGYLFAPIPACLAAGQIGIVLLLGVVLFLRYEQRHPFLAGTVLLIPFVKPHLFSAFWLIMALRVVMRKQWSLAAGFLAALAVAVAVALRYDPGVFSDYQQMVRQAAIQYEFIPALSGVVRLIFFRRFFWVQFVPMGAAVLWALWYYRANWQSWSWPAHGPALLVASSLAAPYAWLSDEAVVLPAVLLGVLWIYRVRKKLTLTSNLAIFTFACLEFLLLLLLRARIPFATGIYFWSSLLWTAWYWYARRFRERAKA